MTPTLPAPFDARQYEPSRSLSDNRTTPTHGVSPAQSCDPDLVDETKRRIDCRSLAEDLGVRFRTKTGDWWTCRCPLPGHDDRDPSCRIGLQGWRCHGCGESGDVFALYQRVAGVDFPTAKRELAQRAGLDDGAGDYNPRRLPDALASPVEPAPAYLGGPDPQRVEAARKTLTQVWRRLHWPIQPHQDAVIAASYLEGRGISPAMAAREGVRVAGPGLWRGIRHDFDADALEAAGMRNPDTGALHPFWWYRGPCLVFPYYGADGEIASLRFRRVFDDDGPKALGLRSTPTQVHRPPLPFGAPEHTELAQGETGLLYVVEGELDALSLWWECRRAVAAPGASQWPEAWCAGWERLSAVVVLEDGDDAGSDFAFTVREAAESVYGPRWVRCRFHVRSFPRGQDANDLLIDDSVSLRATLRVVESELK